MQLLQQLRHSHPQPGRREISGCHSQSHTPCPSLSPLLLSLLLCLQPLMSTFEPNSLYVHVSFPSLSLCFSFSHSLSLSPSLSFSLSLSLSLDLSLSHFFLSLSLSVSVLLLLSLFRPQYEQKIRNRAYSGPFSLSLSMVYNGYMSKWLSR